MIIVIEQQVAASDGFDVDDGSRPTGVALAVGVEEGAAQGDGHLPSCAVWHTLSLAAQDKGQANRTRQLRAFEHAAVPCPGIEGGRSLRVDRQGPNGPTSRANAGLNVDPVGSGVWPAEAHQESQQADQQNFIECDYELYGKSPFVIIDSHPILSNKRTNYQFPGVFSYRGFICGAKWR